MTNDYLTKVTSPLSMINTWKFTNSHWDNNVVQPVCKLGPLEPTKEISSTGSWRTTPNIIRLIREGITKEDQLAIVHHSEKMSPSIIHYTCTHKI